MLRLVCLSVFALLLLTACGGNDLDQLIHSKLLTEIEKCEGCDLAGTELSGANLTRANLTGARLTEANLTRANLAAANLKDAT
jgi:uncharacterized protein YjbI with pentapeptide repeats|tara:strand:- start:1124 stop:1372 length:249 start_codon:yes stop_codon:yes gene_type:complete